MSELEEPAARALEKLAAELPPNWRAYLEEELRIANEARRKAYRQIEPMRRYMETVEAYAEKHEELDELVQQLLKENVELKKRLARLEARYGIYGE